MLGHLPTIQLGCFTTLALINLIFLVHEQLYVDRWMYQLEVFNDFSVYLTGIHGLAFTATTTNYGAFDAIGYSLAGMVILNLLFNMGIVIVQSCIRLKRNLAVKYTKAQA